MTHVTIFRFEVYDAHTDCMVKSRRWGVREAVEQIAHGVIIESSATEVPRSALMSDIPGLSEIDFDPSQLHVATFQRTVKM